LNTKDLNTTIGQALNQARQQLKEKGTGSPALDAEVLLSSVTGLDRAGLYREWERRLPGEEEARFFELVRRRGLSEPVAYLTGHKEFMGLDFTVGPSVLVPRPETELLVETALEVLPPSAKIIDVGTGSGAIAVSLASFLEGAVVYATDRSPEALDVARLNAARLGVGERCFFYHGNLLEPLSGLGLRGRVDLIAANLPYIGREEYPGLPEEVRLYEPPPALDGGAGGLDLYRRLIPAAPEFLKKGGLLLMEIGCRQGQALSALLSVPVWKVTVRKDLAGLDRLVVARYAQS
jgi:release factor glutamine methyltransferase